MFDVDKIFIIDTDKHYFSSKLATDMSVYFIVSGEISVYLMKIKVVSITSELISYHFTSD